MTHLSLLSVVLHSRGITFSGVIEPHFRINERMVRRIARQITLRPAKLVRRNSGLDKVLGSIRTPHEAEKFIATYSRREPLFLLLECTGWACPSSRGSTNVRSHALETIESFEHNDGVLRYLSIGAGALLQDIICLTKILKKIRPHTCEIYLIDPIYEPLFTPNWAHSPLSKTYQILQQERIYQCVRWCVSYSPHLAMTISAFGSLEDYVAFRGDKYKADIVVALDSGFTYEECINFCHDTGHVISENAPGNQIRKSRSFGKKSRLSR